MIGPGSAVRVFGLVRHRLRLAWGPSGRVDGRGHSALRGGDQGGLLPAKRRTRFHTGFADGKMHVALSDRGER